MKYSIKAFTRAWQEHERKYRLYGYGSPPKWKERYTEAGFYSVKMTDYPFAFDWWNDMRNWCDEQFGSEHYECVGFTFWFESEQHAVSFILRWR